MKRAKIKTAVPFSAGERYVEFTDSNKQLDRARKALGLKENEALLVFTDGERESSRWRLTCTKTLPDRSRQSIQQFQYAEIHGGEFHSSFFGDNKEVDDPLRVQRTARGGAGH